MSFLEIILAIILFPLALVGIWFIFLAIIMILCWWQCQEPKDKIDDRSFFFLPGGFFGNWPGPK